jgi:class 3 adenylate cyclase
MSSPHTPHHQRTTPPNVQDVLGVDFSGSSFVAVSGHDDNAQHAALILRAAHAMLAVAAGTTTPDGSPLAVRLGVHTGPLTTGVPARCGGVACVLSAGAGRQVPVKALSSEPPAV